MADPLSITGTAAGLISLGIQVTQSLIEFYNSYKSRDSTLAGTVERLGFLSDTFQCLEKTLLDRKIQPGEESLIKTVENSIQNCTVFIHELREECQKFHKTSSNGIIATFKVAGRRVTYPFRQSTLEKLDEDITETRDNLSSALDVLQLKDNIRTHDSIEEVKVLLELVRSHQISTDLRDWLKAPDATVNHYAARDKKHPGTGMWLIKSPVFLRWLTEPSSILWLNGFAGSGKSVLCSTATEFALRKRRSDPHVGVAFFYFTFSDDSKQSESAMLRALLLQLSGQLQDGEADLTSLRDSYKDGIPSFPLIEHLRYLIQRFHHVYIALDGLDESPRDGPRKRVLGTLDDMRNWSIQGLHLFVTSRDEPDIRESLDLDVEHQVMMRNDEIDKDIANFISGRFDKDRKLRRWLPHRVKIQETLSNRAKGVFRWAECQLVSLQDCPNSKHLLDRLLDSLPQSLEETYERMLCNIDHYLEEDARRILTLLCFAARPLTVRELIDGVAVDINNDLPGLNRERRLQNFDDLHRICPGLININRDLNSDGAYETYQEEDSKNSSLTVQIAHFSVQEYLESERIRHPKAAIFGMSSPMAHAEIAQICLVYLLELEDYPSVGYFDYNPVSEDLPIVQDYPLTYFAARHWYHHYQNTEQPALRRELDSLILRLFQPCNSFASWVTFYDTDRTHWDDYKAGAPVYFASFLGLEHVLDELTRTANVEDITARALSLKPTSKISELVNAKGGKYGNALQAASLEGHEKIIQRLLDKGADVNAQGGYYGNALQAASYAGHEKIIQPLLDKGADVNAQGGEYGNALQAASYQGNAEIIQRLLDKGADVNAQGGEYGNALQAASYQGNEEIIQRLLDKGADVNAQGGFYRNALYAAASWGGHEEIIQRLLDKGADVNAQGGYYYGNALQAASYAGHEKIIQPLLDNGVDVNAQGGFFGNALQAASWGGHEKIIQRLLDKGADVNAQGGFLGNALQAASFEGHEEIIQRLLDKGADVNAQGGHYGNALQAASYRGHEEIIQPLLDKGADVNAQGGYYGNALQAASYRGHEEIIQRLLDNGADVNAQGGFFGNALQAASWGGHEKIIQRLLDKGADVNAQDGHYGNALQAGSFEGHEEIIQRLLDKGADVNAQGGEYGNALQAASSRGFKGVVQLLLDNGADDSGLEVPT